MSKLIPTLLFSVLATPVLASDYLCKAKANPQRGFPMDFEIQVSPAAAGGRMELRAQQQTQRLGAIVDIGSVESANADQRQAFEAVLGFFGEPDVSGIAAADLEKVTKVTMLKTYIEGKDEAAVVQFFTGDTQVGGTFFVGGSATACLP